MTRLRFSALALLLLSACSQSPQPPADRPVDAVRVDLPSPAPARPVRAKEAKPAWSGGGAQAGFGYPGEKPLMTLACKSGQIIVTRREFAPPGAQALFALIGNGTILRLPVDAIKLPGTDHAVWQGALAADDLRAAVFGASAVAATLPGGGRIELAGGGAMQAVAQGCGAPAGATVAKTP